MYDLLKLRQQEVKVKKGDQSINDQVVCDIVDSQEGLFAYIHYLFSQEADQEEGKHQHVPKSYCIYINRAEGNFDYMNLLLFHDTFGQ